MHSGAILSNFMLLAQTDERNSTCLSPTVKRNCDVFGEYENSVVAEAPAGRWLCDVSEATDVGVLFTLVNVPPGLVKFLPIYTKKHV